MPSSYAIIWAYPWDLHDEDPETVVPRLKNEVGLSAMSLASAYHSFEMLRPHLPGQNLLQIPESAVYFQPQTDLYRETVLQPHISPLMGPANWYEKVARAAHKTGLDLIAWTVFLHTSYQARAHPECAEVACTGDISTHHLCPANPDVRAYACALSRDLAQNYGLTSLECEGLNFGGFGHIHYHAKYGVDLGPGGRFLFSLCFCNACKAVAQNDNLDADALQKSVHSRIASVLATGEPLAESPEALAGTLPDLQSYLDCREHTVASLLTDVRNAAGIPVSFLFMGLPEITGANRSRISSLADYVEILSYTADPERTRQSIAQLAVHLASPDQIGVGLQAYPPASPDAATLMANLEAALEQGVSRFSFYNYGIMPLPNLDWIRQAIKRT